MSSIVLKFNSQKKGFGYSLSPNLNSGLDFDYGLLEFWTGNFEI